jgi:hypothetical protein
VLGLGPAHIEYLLRHWDGNDFTIAAQGEDATNGSVSRVTFEVGKEHRAGSVTVEQCEESGWGRFVRH